MILRVFTVFLSGIHASSQIVHVSLAAKLCQCTVLKQGIYVQGDLRPRKSNQQQCNCILRIRAQADGYSEINATLALSNRPLVKQYQVALRMSFFCAFFALAH